MINMPLPQIKQRISQKSGLSEEELNEKIKAKLKQLSGLISEEGAAHIIANELGVKLFDVGEKLQIKNILSGMRNVELVAKVIQVYELREFKTEKHQGKVSNMLVGDDTGMIRVVMWHNQAELVNKLKEGDVIKISRGYVRENQGRNEIHVGDTAKLIINPPGVTVEVKPYTPPTAVKKNISEIQENDANVEVLATIVQVFDLNFFEVCPECKKRVRYKDDGFTCPIHNKVEPDFNYVLNLYLDDGSDNIRVVFWSQQVEQLLDMDKSQIMTFKDDPSKFEPLKTELLGNIIKVSGRANKNQNFDRIELVANNVDRKPDPDEEIRKLKQEADKVVGQDEEKPAPEVKESAAEAEKASEPVAEPQTPKTETKPATSSDDLENLDLDKELMDIE